MHTKQQQEADKWVALSVNDTMLSINFANKDNNFSLVLQIN